MWKFLTTLTACLILPSIICSDFKLLSCRNETTGQPELTYSVSKAYFDANMNDENELYTFNGSDYIRSMAVDDLELAFTDDAITLSYSPIKNITDLNLEGGFGVTFVDNTACFQCSYDRTVVTNSLFETIGSLESHSGNATLDYSMEVKVNETDGRTCVTSKPDHTLDIYPRVVECKVEDSHGNRPVHLIHSWKQSTCLDKTRFDAKQTSFAPEFEFCFRSFRYEGDIKSKQKQIITCIFQLEERVEPYIEPEDCDCYTERSCTSVDGFGPTTEATTTMTQFTVDGFDAATTGATTTQTTTNQLPDNTDVAIYSCPEAGDSVSGISVSGIWDQCFGHCNEVDQCAVIEFNLDSSEVVELIHYGRIGDSTGLPCDIAIFTNKDAYFSNIVHSDCTDERFSVVVDSYIEFFLQKNVKHRWIGTLELFDGFKNELPYIPTPM